MKKLASILAIYSAIFCTCCVLYAEDNLLYDVYFDKIVPGGQAYVVGGAIGGFAISEGAVIGAVKGAADTHNGGLYLPKSTTFDASIAEKNQISIEMEFQFIPRGGEGEHQALLTWGTYNEAIRIYLWQYPPGKYRIQAQGPAPDMPVYAISSDIQPNNWYKIRFAVSQSGEMKLVVNNQEQISVIKKEIVFKDLIHTRINIGAEAVLSMSTAKGERPFQGLVRSVKIWKSFF